MRIASFFSSATELLYALGLGRSVVGRSEHCDYPLGARRHPIIVRSRVASARLSSRGIHDAVESLRRRGEHHYDIDVPLLKRLRPDLVVTQELCNVCAASHPEVLEAVAHLSPRPRSIAISAGRFEELFDAIRALGAATNRAPRAAHLIHRLRHDVTAVQQRLRGIRARPRVWCAEWLDPLMAAGHWMPELVTMAGGQDKLGHVGRDSVCVAWEDVRRYDPEVILVMPCSFSMARTVKEFPLLRRLPGWDRLSAVAARRVFAVNTAFFHRPGPRLVTGLRIMASLCHPERFPRPFRAHARPLL